MYDHYIGVDWAQSNVAVCQISKNGNRVYEFEISSDVRELKHYLNSKQGKIFLTFEESTCAQWLYTELRDQVERLLICDPRRNRYLNEAQQTDKIDARKLAELARAGLLKEIFHSGDDFINLRKVVSGYEDTIIAGVKLKNQKSAILRANGLMNEENLLNQADLFVLTGINERLKIMRKKNQGISLILKNMPRHNQLLKN